jgi:hypothetical protein
MSEHNIHESPIFSPDSQQIGTGYSSNINGEVPQKSQKVKRLQGWYIIDLIFLVIAGATFLPAINLAAEDIFGSWNFSELGNELLDYVENNNQRFPAAEKWCDVLLEIQDDYYSFKQYKDNKASFPYTLNKHVYEQDEIPDNMVVLFSGVTGWNQVGDIELVKNQGRLKVCFGNGDIRTFRKHQLPYLRWKFEDSGIIPEPDFKIPFLVMSALLAIVFLSLLVIYRECLKIFWIFAVGMGILSAGAGVWLGCLAEEVYYKLDSPRDFIAPWIGGIWGFVIGASFIAVIGKIYKKYNAKVRMLGYATVIGIITGIIVSSIVHAYLMIVYQESDFSYLLAGSCFGIIAGFLLGWISSGLIRFYKNNPLI